MLSLAMIRVEPGSTPGIGITITEFVFLAFSSFVRSFCVLLFPRGIGRMSLLQQRCWKDFTIYLYLVLGTTYYIKSDNVDEDGTWRH